MTDSSGPDLDSHAYGVAVAQLDLAADEYAAAVDALNTLAAERGQGDAAMPLGVPGQLVLRLGSTADLVDDQADQRGERGHGQHLGQRREGEDASVRVTHYGSERVVDSSPADATQDGQKRDAA